MIKMVLILRKDEYRLQARRVVRLLGLRSFHGLGN